MKIKVPNSFQGLDLTDRQLIFAELVYNLSKHYAGKYRFCMHKSDVKFLTRVPKSGKNMTANNITRLYKGAMEVVELTDESYLVSLTGKWAHKQRCFEHELTDIDAIKLYCYLLGRVNSDIYDQNYEKLISEKTVVVSKESNVISPYQLQQLDVNT